MPPITWRNVNAPSAQGASKILAQAGKSANQGISQLTGLANQVGDVQAANQLNQNRINTEAALGGISGLGTQSVLDAARQSGQYSPEQLAPGVDQTAVRKALQNQDVVIGDRLNKEFQRGQQQQARTDFGVNQDIANAVASNNLPLANKLISGDNAPANIATGQNLINRQQASNVAAQRAADERQNEIVRQENAPLVEQVNLQNVADKAKEDVKLQTALDKLPVDKPVTAKQQAVTPESAIKNIRNTFQNKTWWDSATDSGGTELVDRITTGISGIETTFGKPVPGYIMDEVTKQIGAESSGEQGAWFNWDKSANSNRYLELIKARMRQAGQSDENRIKRGANQRDAINAKLQLDLDAVNNRSQYNPLLQR